MKKMIRKSSISFLLIALILMSMYGNLVLANEPVASEETTMEESSTKTSSAHEAAELIPASTVAVSEAAEDAKEAVVEASLATEASSIKEVVEESSEPVTETIAVLETEPVHVVEPAETPTVPEISEEVLASSEVSEESIPEVIETTEVLESETLDEGEESTTEEESTVAETTETFSEESVSEETSAETTEESIAETSEESTVETAEETETTEDSSETEAREEASSTESKSESETKSSEETAPLLDSKSRCDLPNDKPRRSQHTFSTNQQTQALRQTNTNPASTKADSSTKTVSNFDELKNAINNAVDNLTIIVTRTIEITEKLIIRSGLNLTLTANNKKQADGTWEPIKQPADYKDAGEAKQREIIEEARKRAEEALRKADEALPSKDAGDIFLKRAASFLNASLFDVKAGASLTLGTQDSAIYIDGNKEVSTTIGAGVIVDVSGKLTLTNGTLMNVNNGSGYTAAVNVKKNAVFNMDGGRISNNSSYQKINSYEKPFSAGAVYVNPGGTFNMNNGTIDHNTGGTGGVFAGDLFGSQGAPATINMNGGQIVKNKSTTSFSFGGGMNLGPASLLNMKDGVIAGNKSGGVGGGLSVSDTFINEFSNTYNNQWVKSGNNYERHLKDSKAEANIDGGVIYKNVAASTGGGIYADSNFVHMNKGMLLDNSSINFGGGLYVSYPPRTQTLKNLLVTENTAKGWWSDVYGGGNGGGLWNCPTGFVHIGDGHSVYIFDNDADGSGKDITFSKKTSHFLLNQKSIKNKFYSHISPVTEGGNIIKFIEDGTEGVVIPVDMSYTNLMSNLLAQYDTNLRKEAWSNSKFFILGNTSRNGGGIGSNANMTTDVDEGEYKLEVEKKWDVNFEEGRKPGIEADIFIVPLDVDETYVKSRYGDDPRLFKYGEIELNDRVGWKKEFSAQQNANFDTAWQKYLDKPVLQDGGLPFTAAELRSKGYKYLVVERSPEDQFFVSEVEDSEVIVQKAEKAHNFVITNYKAAEAVVEKKWDEEIKDAQKPEAVTFYLLLDGKPVVAEYDKNGKPVYRTISLSAKENWQGKFDRLNPRYLEEGRYSIREEEMDKFLPLVEFQEATETASYAFVATNYYKPGHEIVVEKKWVTEKGTKLPNDLKVTIEEKGKDPIELSLNKDNKWTATKIVKGEGLLSQHNYTVKENLSEEDLKRFIGKDAISIFLNFKNKDAADARQIKYIGPNGSTIELDELNELLKGQVYRFKLKSASKDVNEVHVEKINGEYVVHYPVNVLASEEMKVEFTNTEARKIKIQKIWEDEDDRYNNRPDQITVKINSSNSKGEEKEYTVKLSADEDWKGQSELLPIFDEDGKRINYETVEIQVPAYEEGVWSGNEKDGYVLVNRLKYLEAEIQKIWDDENNASGKRPKSITVQLMANGKVMETIEITPDENGDWKHSLSKLPEYINKEKVEYSLVEKPVDGYESKVEGMKITNKLKPTEPEPTPPPVPSEPKPTPPTEPVPSEPVPSEGQSTPPAESTPRRPILTKGFQNLPKTGENSYAGISLILALLAGSLILLRKKLK